MNNPALTQVASRFSACSWHDCSAVLFLTKSLAIGR